MKGTIETPKVAKLVLALLTSLFFESILTLERDSSNQVVFGKQLDIKACLKKVQNFVLTHPYGIFNVEVLDSLKRDLENPTLVITFKNFDNEVPNMIPMKYHIILDETYTTFEAYQSSPSGILIKILV